MKRTVLTQTPVPGARLLCHAGDLLTVDLTLDRPLPGRAVLRTNLGRSAVAREARIAFVERSRPMLAADWHDLPMLPVDDRRFRIRLPLLEVGEFAAKACLLPEQGGAPLWPEGENVTLKVAPAWTLCANTVYTAFVRQYLQPDTPSRAAASTEAALDRRGYSVIPPSGTFRQLIRHLDHIFDQLGFRVLQLLPIHPTPTTYARMGRFGSPFAATDFLSVDPALAEFDRRATPLDQFRELIDAVHARGGRLFIDLPANHTGWASSLQMHRPEWFRREANGAFQSPGAWGVIWEDLAELDYTREGVSAAMADVFCFWCAQGVDGFRCDAGYMLPASVWHYIVAKTRERYPDTVFLLEGLGGKLSVTERLLRDANLDWAYSEVFQTEDRQAFEQYLPGAMALSRRTGPLIHFAETHDNTRLAARGETYARLRTALAALLSHQGAFGLTNGVEWFADAKLDVHENTPMRWGARRNQVKSIRRLNTLLATHPAFGPDVCPQLVTVGEGNVLAVLREGADARLLVLANLDCERPQRVGWPRAVMDAVTPLRDHLRRNHVSQIETIDAKTVGLMLEPGQVCCLEPRHTKVARRPGRPPSGLEPARVTLQRERLEALRLRHWLCSATPGVIESDHSHRAGLCDDEAAESLAEALVRDPMAYCRRFIPASHPLPVMTWNWPEDARRQLALPPGYILAVRSPTAFHLRLVHACGGGVNADGSDPALSLRQLEGEALWRAAVAGEAWSIPLADGSHIAFLCPSAADACIGAQPTDTTPFALPSGERSPGQGSHRRYQLLLTRYVDGRAERHDAPLLALAPGADVMQRSRFSGAEVRGNGFSALLTNGRGAMARAPARWGEVRSQYDALLAANLHPEVPVDRTVVFTRCRGWVLHQGYSQAINADLLMYFEADPGGTRADWHFHAPVGGGRWIPLTLSLRMQRGCNRVTLSLTRAPGRGRPGVAPDAVPVSFILRPDIEWRGFHEKTKAFTGPEGRWPGAVTSLPNGFRFRPETDTLRITCAPGEFSPEPEWLYQVPHPIDAERGLEGASDLFSPGYFQLELTGGQRGRLTAEIEAPPDAATEAVTVRSPTVRQPLEAAMRQALETFIVRRGQRHTVIAGYPWFLDWGRDTLIVLRGMIAMGMREQSLDILCEFARFEAQGTLPNMIRGENSDNRDTSDAPLWFIRAAVDAMSLLDPRALLELECGGRSLAAVIASILTHYLEGTPNGIRVDPESGLVYSPPHFTWMDTNHPAGTPRAGYPVEIQALWLDALRFGIRHLDARRWSPVYRKAMRSFTALFTREPFAHLCDCRFAEPGQPAAAAVADDALRCNTLLALALGAVGHRARAERALIACEALLIPGAVRSLADREVGIPLEIRHHGRLLGDPRAPYRGRYAGDEDTERKPAYHNGTAWSWVFPSYVEALLRLYGASARETALALLGGSAEWVNRDCVGHVPEVLDGDAPHTPRGCDAQAWGVSEWLRVYAHITNQGA